MVRIQLSLELNYLVAHPGADFIFNIHASHTRSQTVVDERLQLSQAVPHDLDTDAVTGNRTLRLSAAPGPLKLNYDATVDLNHHVANPPQIAEVPVARLPASVLPYVYPSRYCQSDRLGRLAIREFGGLWQGYSRVQAIRDWVNQRVAFTPNSTNSATSAADTLLERVGVCRDFAHLMIALCRAVNIPARFTTGFDYGADPALGPPDFHAYVEAYLGDRWYLFDPSGTAIPMGFVRLATGRDAADVAFATIFGTVQSPPPIIQVQAIGDLARQFELPRHRVEALSTDDGLPHDHRPPSLSGSSATQALTGVSVQASQSVQQVPPLQAVASATNTPQRA
ncbi:MAG: transglutaminase family protein [Leptothrix sp. (in: b-proteobacteria)]